MKFHVEHNVTPKHFEAILSLFSSYSNLTSTQIFDILNNGDHKINSNYLSKNLKVLVIFGIMDSYEKHYTLSPLGKKLLHSLQYDKKKFYDICHYLYYSSWSINNNSETAFSWTYKAITDYLWDNTPNYLDDTNIISIVLNRAQTDFPDNQISLSHWAVSGVRNWLSVLDPAFIILSNKTKNVQRRSFCSPELFLLAIDYYYKTNKNNYGTPILLNEHNKEHISKLCLIDINVFGYMLDLTSSIFPQIHKDNSVWGVSISINEPINLINIL